MLELLALLRRTSARVVTATDGDAALQALRVHRPRVAVLDADMPRQSGFDVASSVRDDPELAETRVLVVTAHAGAEERALAAGVARCLPKPFSPRELLDAVRDLAA